VLVVAGAFKRGEPDLDEGAILMRALRDFNLPKIIADDLGIFHGLLGDLFPGIDPPRKRDMRLEGLIEQAAVESKLNPDPDFVLKVVQLGELLEIRHCVFVMGPPACGKSETWKTLAKSQDLDGKKTTTVDLNPKVTSTNELYGVVLMATREWKDGLMSKTMRDLANKPDTNPKWIILDGDLDANWIESMNSVMDDNKLLTLASNERIPLKPHMRLIFEIRDLRFATPATVSRAGILFISDVAGSQWRSYVKSWIKHQSYDNEKKTNLQQLFDKYLPETLKHCAKTFKHIVPQVQLAMVMSLCKLLENMLKKNDVKGLELLFVFATIWCVGGGYAEEQKKNFSNWWKDKWKTIKFSNKGTVFDYYVDIENSKLEDWSKMSGPDIISTIDTSKSIPSYTIPTVDTISAQFLLRQFIQINHCTILVGAAGCGKTQIIKGLLNELVSHGEEYMQQIINFNYYTDANLLQLNLEQFLEKKAGKTFAPPGRYKLMYFVDDMNMPARDPYDTQNAIALLRQHRDYEHWYDKQKLALKDIKNTQLIAAMNPTAGSFIVNPRLQRHFWLLAVGFPEQTSLSTIYSAYLNKHFSKFNGAIQAEIGPVIKATLQLHNDVERNFKKTAANFHYEFNVRHLTNVFQGLLTAKQEAIKAPDNFIKLWVHEADRIYGDRLVSYANLATFKAAQAELVSKSFSKFNLKRYFGATPEPLIFANFVASLDDKLYDQFPNAETLSTRLGEALREYNDTNAVMDLVLFEDAMKHVCKISRIISAESGHALLVGVGGSGKQSLSRLASFICQFTTTGIMISSTYGVADLKADLQTMYQKSGIKDEGMMFLFTEGQITNERFLVYLNDLLSSGEIADLFAAEDVDGIINNIRPAVKSEGLQDTKDNCWKFFIGRVKKNLHMALCFSPGESLRNRARKFPALINCTVIDWFHPWPEDALLNVAQKFLADIEMDTPEIRSGIERFMPYSFKTVNQYSEKILDQERRFVYTTPKSFLELIKLFKVMLGKKQGELIDNKDKYETGVVKLTETGEIVAKLEEELKIFSVEVEAKKKSADEQAEIVGGEKVKVEAQNAIAEEEAKKCFEIKTNVEAKMSSVQADLDAALPLVEKAKKALDGLNIEDFRMLKALKNPPADIDKTFTCVLNLLCKIDPVVPVDKNGKLKTENTWKTALACMQNPQVFLDHLNSLKGKIDNDEIKDSNFKANRATLAEETFKPEILAAKSASAGGLCDFIINITAYYDVVVSVEPKKLAVAEAQAQLAEANEKKRVVDELVAKLNAELAVLMDAYNKAMNEKETAMREAERCERKLNLAQRLVNALGAEQERWAQSIIDLGELLKIIIGDVLLSSAFVSYVGPFNKQFRDAIMADFVTFFKQNAIPMSAAADPLAVLTDEATIAGWNNFSLPPDRVSTENGSILTNSERYPLIIDPQLQGINWLRKTWEKHDLKVTRLNNPKMVKTIELAVEAGSPVIMENMENSIDAVIQPVYSRAIVKRGKSKYIRMGDKELSLSPNFKLFLHTKLSNPHYPPEI
jgi:dynein heavy chain